MRPKAIIFDWDDTIVDSWHIIHSAINTTLEAMGDKPWTEEEARQRIGPPARVLFTQLFGEDRWQEADRIYIDAYKKSIADNIEAHEHSEAILRELSSAGVYLAVVSSKRGPILREEAKHLGFDTFFRSLVGAGDAERDKPDIAAVLLALQGSGIAPGKDVWLIGDGNTDMIAAHNAGLTPVLIETKLPSEESLARNPPAFRFKTHKELLEFLSNRIQPAPEAKKSKGLEP